MICPRCGEAFSSHEGIRARENRILDMWFKGSTAVEIAKAVGLRSPGGVMNIISAARDAGDPRAVAGGPVMRKGGKSALCRPFAAPAVKPRRELNPV